MTELKTYNSSWVFSFFAINNELSISEVTFLKTEETLIESPHLPSVCVCVCVCVCRPLLDRNLILFSTLPLPVTQLELSHRVVSGRCIDALKA